jgi:hypothetical protein
VLIPETEPNDDELRSALDRITETHIGEAVGAQRQLVGELASSPGHSISMVREAVCDDQSTFKYTCFQYAFGLVDPPQAIVDIATLHQNIYPNGEFVEHLIASWLEEIDPRDANDDDVVVYSDGGMPTHAGKVRGGMIESKWGTAHLWRHRLFEVPLRYGSTVRFFKAIEASDCQLAFFKYAEAKLGTNLT